MKIPAASIKFIAIFLLTVTHLQAQDFDAIFEDVVMRTDTSSYRYTTNHLVLNDEKHLYFQYESEEKIAEFELHPYNISIIDSLSIIPSGDFEIIDSFLNINNEYFRFKIQFNDLTSSEFLKFSFIYKDTAMLSPLITELRLFPYTSTYAKFYPLSDELFIGEEKVFEIVTNNIENIRFSNDWQEEEGLNYRFTKTFNQLRMHIIPNELGEKTINIKLSTSKPYLSEDLQPVYEMAPIEYRFNVRKSRLQFINIDKREITLDDSTRSQGIEIQMDNSQSMRMQKTYRVENQEEPGGTLIAEIFTRNPLTNNRTLSWLRVYNHHREAQGYLYIKDGDQAQFITNFNITPRTEIRSIQILRDGQWTGNLSVHPGEIIELKIEGQELHKANFIFEELIDLTTDTLIQSGNMIRYRYQVPMNVINKRISLYNHGQNTGRSLNVKEYQEPRPFDFIWINYDGTKRTLADLQQTVLVDKTVQDVIFGGERRVIDSEGKLYGKQYLKVEMTVTGRRDELIEMKTIENIVVCPGINSPRYEHYAESECGPVYFGLNDYLRKKTHQLDIWSKIRLKISHQKDKYEQSGYEKEIEIILKKEYSFDIDLSFPAGLITVSKPDEDSGDDKLGSLSGISIAMIAQFTFYHPEKINTPRPYKIGAGFLAMNTFNFSDTNSDRDLGIVIIGSLYPTTKDVKLTFPLYVGGGYFLQQEKFFFLVGPGIRIRF